MIIVNLNIRGLGGGTKARYLRHIVAKEGAEFLCLQEAKISSFSDSKCFSLWGVSNIGWVHYEGVNGAGSIVTMWQKKLSHMVVMWLEMVLSPLWANFSKPKVSV